MSEVKIPTCGRVVYFYHNDCDAGHHCAANGAEKVPAFVVQEGYLHPNLSVFPMNPDGTNVLRYSVPHISVAIKDAEGKPQSSYWDWPTIN